MNNECDEDENEWPTNWCDTIVCPCERCHEIRPTQLVLDPFVKEGITEGDWDHREYWCLPCWESRCGDV